jgi:LacI family transcriptional regulator, galactose operon repressor
MNPMADHRNISTITDVARRAGVSIATVSRVLNGSTPVIEGTADRVRAAIDELHYRPRAAARILASRHTDTLGLLLPEIGGAFFSPLLRGIEAEARAASFDLLVHATSHIPHASTPAPHRPLAEHNTDGLVVFTQSLDPDELARLYRLNFPVVLIYQNPPHHLDIPTVVIDNTSGARRLVAHLIETHGCQRIAFLRGPKDNEDSEQRELGYRQALESHGIAFDPTLIGTGGFNDEEGQAATQRWLVDGLDFDAVFAGDDDTAVGVLSALHRAGKNVPRVIKVAGFDDLPVARFLSPPLTTVNVPIEKVGREAIRQLVRLIRGQPAQPRTMIHTQLVIRESCGCNTDSRHPD